MAATGCGWVTAEPICGNRVSDTTLRDSEASGSPLGVFDAMVAEALGAYDRTSASISPSAPWTAARISALRW
ncbi:MAG: hypothetical protein M3063_10880 [Actinomycetota bacterium]|nr:hypothetical protein [Actinomycetota bacterium]